MKTPLVIFSSAALCLILSINVFGQELTCHETTVVLTNQKVESLLKYVDDFTKTRISKVDLSELSKAEISAGKILVEGKSSCDEKIKLNLYVPSSALEAKLVITDPNRLISKAIDIDKGESSLWIDNIKAQSDSIIYSLIVNEEIVDTKNLYLK